MALRAKQTSLAGKVFDVVAARLREKAATLSSFARTNRSFEEWINWESFHALEVAGFTVEPKPAYARRPDMGRGTLLADLGVTAGGRVVVEVAACTDATQWKWAHKILGNAAKLAANVHSPAEALQLVVLVSSDLETDPWRAFLKMIRWGDGSRMEMRAKGKVATNGKPHSVTIRGWTGGDLVRRAR